MATTLARSWWLLALRGVFGILFGIGAFVWPDATLATLVLLFSAYALVDGASAVATGFGLRGQLERWWLLVIEGLAGIVVGALAFMWPGTTVLAVISLIAAWSIITGAFEIATALRLRKVIDNEWLLVLSGVLSIVFGALLFALPGPGVLVLIWMIGSYAIVFGALTLALAFRMRAMRDDVGRRTTRMA